jgi:hypothetical protein
MAVTSPGALGTRGRSFFGGAPGPRPATAGAWHGRSRTGRRPSSGLVSTSAFTKEQQHHAYTGLISRAAPPEPAWVPWGQRANRDCDRAASFRPDRTTCGSAPPIREDPDRPRGRARNGPAAAGGPAGPEPSAGGRSLRLPSPYRSSGRRMRRRRRRGHDRAPGDRRPRPRGRGLASRWLAVDSLDARRDGQTAGPDDGSQGPAAWDGTDAVSDRTETTHRQRRKVSLERRSHWG